jgi:flavin prenyltransferase
MKLRSTQSPLNAPRRGAAVNRRFDDTLEVLAKANGNESSASIGAKVSKPRIIVGISGATGIVYAFRLLQALRELNVESHLVISKAAELTRAYESNVSLMDLKRQATVVYSIQDVGAAISSGSFRTMGMVIAPCSIRTLSEIATGVTSTLLTRAADVVLKERRRLVLMVRETPLHLGHLRSMVAVTEAGGIIMPPVPAFYAKPSSLDEMVTHTVGRVLDLYDLENSLVNRWGESGSVRGTSDHYPTKEICPV